LPFPKTSANFRKNQEWVKQGGFAGASGENRSGSNPLASTGK